MPTAPGAIPPRRAGSLSTASSCAGDSGGPLYDARGCQWGIVSHGLSPPAIAQHGFCGAVGQMDSYASVPYFRPWVEAQLAKEGLL